MQKKFYFLKKYNNVVASCFDNASTTSTVTTTVHNTIDIGAESTSSTLDERDLLNTLSIDDCDDETEGDCGSSDDDQTLSIKNIKKRKYDNIDGDAGNDVCTVASFDDCLNDKRQMKAEAFNNLTLPLSVGNRSLKPNVNLERCAHIDADNDNDERVTENTIEESTVCGTFNSINHGKSSKTEIDQDSNQFKDNIDDLLEEFKMARHSKDSTSCTGASTASAYLHNMSDCVVRILKCSIEDIDESKIMEIVNLLETYEASLMFLAFNVHSFENLSWQSVHNRLRKNCFHKRVMVLCNKYFKNKKVNVVVKTIRKYKNYLINDFSIKSHVQIVDTKRDAMFYTMPKPNLKLLIKFQPSHFINEYM